MIAVTMISTDGRLREFWLHEVPLPGDRVCVDAEVFVVESRSWTADTDESPDGARRRGVTVHAAPAT